MHRRKSSRDSLKPKNHNVVPKSDGCTYLRIFPTRLLATTTTVWENGTDRASRHQWSYLVRRTAVDIHSPFSHVHHCWIQGGDSQLAWSVILATDPWEWLHDFHVFPSTTLQVRTLLPVRVKQDANWMHGCYVVLDHKGHLDILHIFIPRKRHLLCE